VGVKLGSTPLNQSGQAGKSRQLESSFDTLQHFKNNNGRNLHSGMNTSMVHTRDLNSSMVVDPQF